MERDSFPVAPGACLPTARHREWSFAVSFSFARSGNTASRKSGGTKTGLVAQAEEGNGARISSGREVGWCSSTHRKARAIGSAEGTLLRIPSESSETRTLFPPVSSEYEDRGRLPRTLVKLYRRLGKRDDHGRKHPGDVQAARLRNAQTSPFYPAITVLGTVTLPHGTARSSQNPIFILGRRRENTKRFPNGVLEKCPARREATGVENVLHVLRVKTKYMNRILGYLRFRFGGSSASAAAGG